MEITTKGVTTVENHLINLMTPIYFTNHQTGSKSCKTPLKFLEKFFKLHMLFPGTIPSGKFFKRLVM